MRVTLDLNCFANGVSIINAYLKEHCIEMYLTNPVFMSHNHHVLPPEA